MVSPRRFFFPSRPNCRPSGPPPGRPLFHSWDRPCRGQIAHYKIPKHIKFVEGFPTTVTGKVQNFAMRDAMITELGLTVAKTA